MECRCRIACLLPLRNSDVSREAAPRAFDGLARTYDPHVLNQLTVGGSLADTDKAGSFYDLSGDGGVKPVPAFAVQPPSCDKSLCMLIQKAGATR
jgi:hypothetical protein